MNPEFRHSPSSEEVPELTQSEINDTLISLVDQLKKEGLSAEERGNIRRRIKKLSKHQDTLKAVRAGEDVDSSPIRRRQDFETVLGSPVDDEKGESTRQGEALTEYLRKNKPKDLSHFEGSSEAAASDIKRMDELGEQLDTLTQDIKDLQKETDVAASEVNAAYDRFNEVLKKGREFAQMHGLFGESTGDISLKRLLNEKFVGVRTWFGEGRQAAQQFARLQADLKQKLDAFAAIAKQKESEGYAVIGPTRAQQRDAGWISDDTPNDSEMPTEPPAYSSKDTQLLQMKARHAKLLDEYRRLSKKHTG